MTLTNTIQNGVAHSLRIACAFALQHFRMVVHFYEDYSIIPNRCAFECAMRTSLRDRMRKVLKYNESGIAHLPPIAKAITPSARVRARSLGLARRKRALLTEVNQ